MVKLKNIEAVILSGGKGSRLYPLTKDIPKALVKIGDIPVIEHIVQYFIYFGIDKIKILIGHKGEAIKEYFANQKYPKNIVVECIPTGEDAGTSERVWKIRKNLKSDFILSYADVLHNVDLNEMFKLHLSRNVVGTMAAVPLRTSYGIVDLNENNVAIRYREKPYFPDTWMNAGLFLFKPAIFEYWENSIDVDFSKGMLPKLCEFSQIVTYKHESFWSGMDTVRENEKLNELWNKHEAEWAFWRK